MVQGETVVDQSEKVNELKAKLKAEVERSKDKEDTIFKLKGELEKEKSSSSSFGKKCRDAEAAAAEANAELGNALARADAWESKHQVAEMGILEFSEMLADEETKNLSLDIKCKELAMRHKAADEKRLKMEEAVLKHLRSKVL